MAWGFSVFWNLVSSPLLFVIPEEVSEKQNYLALLGLMFPLVGLGMILWAILSTARWLKFGRSTLKLDHVPAQLGGVLRARLLSSCSSFDGVDQVEVQLNCVHRYRCGTGDDRRTRERILWQKEFHLDERHVKKLPDRAELPLAIQLPARDEAPETDSRNPESLVIWRLTVRAAVTGVDYGSVFEIPVFDTGDMPSDGGNLPPTELSAMSPATQEFDGDAFASAGVLVNRLGANGVEIHFRAGRHWKAALSLTLFTVLWSGALALMVHLGAPWFFRIAAGLFLPIFAWLLLELWFLSHTVRMTRDGVVVRASLLGIPRTKRLALDEIRGVSKERCMQSGERLFYRIVLKSPGGDILVGQNVASSRADIYVEELERVLQSLRGG